MYYKDILLDFNKSEIHSSTYKDIDFIIKRDDLISSVFSGNKARKIYFLFNPKYKNIRKIISHGSVQSNAMYSLSYYCKIFNKEFDFYVDHIPSYIKNNPEGNYKYALLNGVNFIEGKYKKNDLNNISENELFIDEGIKVPNALEGISFLAKEIIEYKNKNNIEKLNIFLPSGTGTSSLFLQKELYKSGDIIYTTNCVGDEDYLKKQFYELEKNSKFFPKILTSKKKYAFGKLYKEFYDIHKSLYEETNIEFDLLYDSKAWLLILENKEIFKNNFLYIHQGGLIGNESMLTRYKRKFG